uniref:Uncharacterized protein n=1 Tax=Setaria viridis TaxID=4556 RepID=A0A4U6UWN3_SETVI|nr:hypothetical protein SEVIR_5G446900v2 [Setaria viridis]
MSLFDPGVPKNACHIQRSCEATASSITVGTLWSPRVFCPFHATGQFFHCQCMHLLNWVRLSTPFRLVLYCSPPMFKWKGSFLFGNCFVLCTNLVHELIFRLTVRICAADIVVHSIKLVNMRDSLVPMFFALHSCSLFTSRCMLVVLICNVLPKAA